MDKPNHKTAKFTIFVGGIGGLLTGTISGGLISIVCMLILAVGDRQSFEIGLLLLTIYLAFLAGAVYGAVVGAFSGLLLGAIFCLTQHRWIGVIGGGLMGLSTTMYIRGNPPNLNLLSTFEIWAFLGPAITGGSIAGYALSCVLLRFCKTNSKSPSS